MPDAILENLKGHLSAAENVLRVAANRKAAAVLELNVARQEHDRAVERCKAIVSAIEAIEKTSQP